MRKQGYSTQQLKFDSIRHKYHYSLIFPIQLGLQISLVLSFQKSLSCPCLPFQFLYSFFPQSILKEVPVDEHILPIRKIASVAHSHVCIKKPTGLMTINILALQILFFFFFSCVLSYEDDLAKTNQQGQAGLVSCMHQAHS